MHDISRFHSPTFIKFIDVNNLLQWLLSQLVSRVLETDLCSTVEAAGGQSLACEVDIRNEEQVVRAVEETVKRFGGIDILINNASAISLTGTTATDMKRFDLLNGINMRGTYIWYLVSLCF